MSIAIILGSSFSHQAPETIKTIPRTIKTPWGTVILHEVIYPQRNEGTAWLIFRHGIPHSLLPHQVNFRAYIAALTQIKCQSLVTCSSVGVLDPTVPLYQPMFAFDLLMPDHRLPNGDICTMFDHPQSEQGHLVLQGPIFSRKLQTQIKRLTHAHSIHWGPDVNFAYVAGPRTKTALENQYWLQLGAQVNSMSIGPETVLAQEMKIPTVALLVGHKYSRTSQNHSDTQKNHMSNIQHLAIKDMQQSLVAARHTMEKILKILVENLNPVEFEHYIYQF